MKYVIIGNSAAGIGTVEGIRQVDRNGEITIITNEAHYTYSRPLISYLLQGKTDEQRMKYRPDDFYEKNHCKVLFSKEVTAIDKDKKVVQLKDAETIPYDKLMVATGSRPFVPPMKGLETVKKQFPFMKLDDAHALKAALTKESKVLIIGAGLIGMKCAEGISDLCSHITIVDMAPRILSSILDETGANIVQEFVEKRNITFELNTSVETFETTKATLVNGKEIPFDIIVLAVGVRPNTSLVADIGGEVNRGIVVNKKLETSILDIYSAGDCSEGYDSTLEGNRILAILPNAYMQGVAAGKNMAGENESYEKGMAMNAIGFWGFHIATAGVYEGEAYTETKADLPYKKLFYQNNRLMGYIIIGNIEQAGIYTQLIREKTPLDTIDFELICERPGLMAFSRETRNQELGGAH